MTAPDIAINPIGNLANKLNTEPTTISGTTDDTAAVVVMIEVDGTPFTYTVTPVSGQWSIDLT
ncbi:MAG: hypothetical protein ABJJ39_01300, partial [Kangiellaceae bacterium]